MSALSSILRACTDNVLMFFGPSGDMPAYARARVVMKLDYEVAEKVIIVDKVAKPKKLLNILRTGSMVDTRDKKNPVRFTALRGKL